MKKYVSFVLFAIIMNFARAQVKYDSSKYVVLQDRKSIKLVFCKKVNSINLTEDEIIKIETLLSDCIDKYNISQANYFDMLVKRKNSRPINKSDMLINLIKYKRQLIAVVNSKGEKEVWVNCFRPSNNFDYRYWSHTIVHVSDGGNYFFNVRINLTTNRYYNFKVNGFG